MASPDPELLPFESDLSFRVESPCEHRVRVHNSQSQHCYDRLNEVEYLTTNDPQIPTFQNSTLVRSHEISSGHASFLHVPRSDATVLVLTETRLFCPRCSPNKHPSKREQIWSRSEPSPSVSIHHFNEPSCVGASVQLAGD